MGQRCPSASAMSCFSLARVPLPGARHSFVELRILLLTVGWAPVDVKELCQGASDGSAGKKQKDEGRMQNF